MESYADSPEKRYFSELLISDELSRRGTDISPALKIEGSEQSVHLTEQEFRIFMFLRKRQGKPASITEIEEFLYGEDDDREISSQSVVPVQVFNLNQKIMDIQNTLRFVILAQHGAGYYLVDLTRPEMLRQGGEERLKELITGSRRGFKGQGRRRHSE